MELSRSRTIVLALVSALVTVLGGCSAAGPRTDSTTVEARVVEYENPPGSHSRRSLIWRLPRIAARMVRNVFVPVTGDRSYIMAPETAAQLRHALDDADSITWIGHMTVLIEIDGVRILTDPWFANHGAPIPIGPKRIAPPSIAVEDLPPIDIVLVSHSHYDHLDLDAVAALPGREHATAVVPLGIGHFFSERGYGHVVELDWEQAVEVDGIRLTALPAIHWSKRGLLHLNDTLWAAFAIEAANGPRIFFGGDSDFGPIHAALGAEWGGFDIALLSIGGFHNPGVHCTPETCAAIGRAIDADVLVPLHWGTIYLGEGPPSELPERFVDAALALGYADEAAWVMQIGETRALPQPQEAGVLTASN